MKQLVNRTVTSDSTRTTQGVVVSNDVHTISITQELRQNDESGEAATSIGSARAQYDDS